MSLSVSARLKKALEESKQPYVEITQDQFVKSQEIGCGNYGKVYEGVLQKEPVAIKELLIPQQDEAEQEKVLELVIEIKNLMNMISPYIVRLKGVCFDPVCFILELMPKNSLRFQLKHHPQELTKNKRLQIMWDSAKGLQVMHDKGMVYCDLKPHNILLDSNHRAVLADLAFARSSEEKVDYPSGTSMFLPKETWEPKASNTQKSDIYSLGLVFLSLMCSSYQQFKALLYVVPYTLPKIIALIRDGTLKDRLIKCLNGIEASGDYPASLTQLVKSCIQDDATKRPDIGEVIEQLRSVMMRDVPGQAFRFFRCFKETAEMAAATTALTFSGARHAVEPGDTKPDFSVKFPVKSIPCINFPGPR